VSRAKGPGRAGDRVDDAVTAPLAAAAGVRPRPDRPVPSPPPTARPGGRAAHGGGLGSPSAARPRLSSPRSAPPISPPPRMPSSMGMVLPPTIPPPRPPRRPPTPSPLVPFLPFVTNSESAPSSCNPSKSTTPPESKPSPPCNGKLAGRPAASCAPRAVLGGRRGTVGTRHVSRPTPLEPSCLWSQVGLCFAKLPTEGA
jgi:hypothetical protein